MGDVAKRLGLWHVRITAALVVAGLGVLAIFWKGLPPRVPLLYSLPWGEEQLVSPWWLWGLPSFCLLVGTVLGMVMGRVIKEDLLEAMILATSLVVQTVITLGLIRIVFLVI